MKKFILSLSLEFILSLSLGLGLGLLVTENSASASACYADGCHIRSGVPWEMFFFDKERRLIGSLPADGGPIIIPESSFPVYVSGCREMHNPNDYNCNMQYEAHMDPGCHVVWAWLRETDPNTYEYTFSWWSCLVGKEEGKSIQSNPPQGAITSKSPPESFPQKPKKPAQKNVTTPKKGKATLPKASEPAGK